MFLAFLAPPEESVWACRYNTGKKAHRETFEDLGTLISKYMCILCSKDPKDPDVPMNWVCASVSENLELHPGFLDFRRTLDMVVYHASHIAAVAVSVNEYTLSTGIVLKKFYHTENGLLTDIDMRKPGSCAFFITGISRHSSVYTRLQPEGSLRPWRYPNRQYSYIRTHTYATILFLNPQQEINLNRGKLCLDLSTTSTWLRSFSNCWAEFIDRNPKVQINGLFVTDNGVFYGCPTDSSVSHQLTGYSAVPIILQYFRDKIGHLVSQILVTSKMKPTDTEATVPKGIYFKFV